MLLEIMPKKVGRPRKRHRDRLRYVRIPVSDEQYYTIRKLVQKRKVTEHDLTVTDVTEELLRSSFERELIWDIPVSKQYLAKTDHSIQAWIHNEEMLLLEDIAAERLSTVRKVAFTLLEYELEVIKP
ncbi:hypothetical protein BC30090_p402 (plasmid) [Bacillus cereus]|uniref:hypothetical protein n=1 Tax=Bacillus TaxID=1386 RepID=UPI001BB4486B|nr:MULTISPECIES: hypothetical protein [Bacillus]BCD26929.1 hypothetical protein BC30090_p402 [Bacillus cereus]